VVYNHAGTIFLFTIPEVVIYKMALVCLKKTVFLFNSFIFEIGFVAFGHFPEEFSGLNGSRLPW